MSIYDRYEQHADKTFRDAREKYLAEFTGKALRRQEYALAHVAPYIDDLPLIDVDDDALSVYKVDRLQVAMAGTVNKEIGTVTTVLNKAARVWRWIPSAPLLQGTQEKAMAACEKVGLTRAAIWMPITSCLRAARITPARRENRRGSIGTRLASGIGALMMC